MPLEGICLRVTHTGVHPESVALYDIEDGIDALGVFRKPGAVYVPFEETVELVYTSSVALSFEIGAMRAFIDQGLLIAVFIFGSSFPSGIIEVRDEGTPLTTDARILDFVGAGVTATNVGSLVTVTIPGGGAAAGADLFLWGAGRIGSSTTTRYLYPSYDDGLAQTVVIQYRVARAGTAQKMRVRHNSSGGNGSAIVYTLRVNGVATALSVSLASTSTDGSDLVSTVAVVAGDLVDVEVTKAAGVGGGPSDITCSVEFI